MANIQKVRSHAAQQIREKRVQRQSNQTPQQAIESSSVPTMPPPAFDRPISKPKQNKRRKGASQPTLSAMPPTSSAAPAAPAPKAPPQPSPIHTTNAPLQSTSSATPAPQPPPAPPQPSPIHSVHAPWSYHPQSLAVPPGGTVPHAPWPYHHQFFATPPGETAGPSFIANGGAAMPPTYAPRNQGFETHPHQVMQRYEPYQQGYINQPSISLQHASAQRHEYTHQPWNYRLPTTTAAKSPLLHGTHPAHHCTLNPQASPRPLTYLFYEPHIQSS